MESSFWFIIWSALILDLLLGEVPEKLHPVVWMGKCINYLKAVINKIPSKFSGLVLTILMILIFLVPLILLLNFLKYNLIIYYLVSAILLSTTFSIKLLISSSRDMKEDLILDLDKARHSISLLVSRNTDKLSRDEIISATVETLAENITDSVIAPLLFFLVFGIPGAFFYRIINTLDAMVGYKNKEHLLMGWFPAKLDDLLNYIPARLAGLIIVLSALILGFNWKNSFNIMMRDAKKTPSPNSGYTMAATAGALEIRLIKADNYVLGDGKNKLYLKNIDEAILLTKTSIALFLVIIFLIFNLILIISHSITPFI